MDGKEVKVRKNDGERKLKGCLELGLGISCFWWGSDALDH